MCKLHQPIEVPRVRIAGIFAENFPIDLRSRFGITLLMTTDSVLKFFQKRRPTHIMHP